MASGGTYSKANSPLEIPKTVRLVTHYKVYDSEMSAIGQMAWIATAAFSVAAWFLGQAWPMVQDYLKASPKPSFPPLLVAFLSVSVLFFILGAMSAGCRQTTVRRIKKQHKSTEEI